MSHPDNDYPCNRLFWETDGEYERRQKRMSTLKGNLVEIEAMQQTRRLVIEEMQVWMLANNRLMLEVGGKVSDYVAKSIYQSGKVVEDTLLAYKAAYQSGVRQVSSMRRELSELTR